MVKRISCKASDFEFRVRILARAYMKKIFLMTPLLILVLLIASQVSANGIVPCGEEGNPCKLCHIFVMLDEIIDFVLVKIVPVLAVLMLVVGGVMLLVGGGNPETIKNAKSLLTAAVIGLVIIYCAWLMVNLFFQLIGVSEWTNLKEGWWQINCQ